MTRRNESQRQRHASMTSAAMVKVAEARKCPACGRKSAMRDTREPLPSGRLVVTGMACRWCGHHIDFLEGIR